MRRFALSGPYVTELRPAQMAVEPRPTGVCAFVGPTASGPADMLSPPLRSFAEFQTIYGGLEPLSDPPSGVDEPAGRHHIHHMGHAAHAFFAQGGQRLHIVSTGTPGSAPGNPALALEATAAALQRLDDEPDISLVAMPACMAESDSAPGRSARAQQQLLLDHVADGRRHRMAILDAPPLADAEAVLAWRESIDSAQAAMYHPWVVVPDPAAPSDTLTLPPSGFLCGIYARSDALRGIHRAPANEVLHGVLRLARPLSHDEQTRLNAQGVNSLRTLSGLGTLVWGARTLSRDREWLYVSVRRHFNHIKASIERGLQWVVFEPNNERLWVQVQSMVSNYLIEEWRMGGLAGQKPEQAFFVRCDRSTMTAADEQAGRLVCLIGVAQTRPSEFRVLRLQLTASGASGPT